MKKVLLLLMVTLLCVLSATALDIASPSLGGPQQERNTSTNSTIIITSQNSDLHNISYTIDASDEYNIVVTDVPTTLASGESATATIEAFIPQNIAEGTHTIGTITVTAEVHETIPSIPVSATAEGCNEQAGSSQDPILSSWQAGTCGNEPEIRIGQEELDGGWIKIHTTSEYWVGVTENVCGGQAPGMPAEYTSGGWMHTRPYECDTHAELPDNGDAGTIGFGYKESGELLFVLTDNECGASEQVPESGTVIAEVYGRVKGADVGQACALAGIAPRVGQSYQGTPLYSGWMSVVYVPQEEITITEVNDTEEITLEVGPEVNNSNQTNNNTNQTPVDSSITLTINGVASDRTVDVNTSVSFFATLIEPTSGTIDILIDGTIAQTGASPLEYNKTFNETGNYTITAQYAGNAINNPVNVSHILQVVNPGGLSGGGGTNNSGNQSGGGVSGGGTSGGNTGTQSSTAFDFRRVKIDCGDLTTVNNGSRIDDITPGASCTLTVKLENDHPTDDLDDIELELESDDGDVDEDSKSINDIDRGDDVEVTLNFDIADNADEQDVKMTLTARGEDENNTVHRTEFLFTLRIEKPKKEVKIDSVTLSRSEVSSCQSTTVTISVRVKNTGSKDTDASIKVNSPALNYEHTKDDIDLNDGESETEGFTVTIPRGTNPGNYLFQISARYDNTVPSDSRVENIRVVSCNTQTTSTQTRTRSTTQQQSEIVLPEVDRAAAETEEPSFLDSATYTALLISGNVVFLVLLGLFISLLMKPPKKPETPNYY